FEDNQFDIVTALDVLEHLDNPHRAFQEMLRVAKKAVFISLPNMYYIQFRWDFLKGKLSGKYIFPPNPVIDRHRWILSYTESVNFIKHNTKEYTVEIQMITPKRGRSKLILEPIESWLAKRWPNLFVYATLFMVKK
ncbi:MAG: methyltransferase domain-containing protein, partial [Halobacteriovoraceae bacterium]|nr:methyltransferase domain-containing protein [Halobacteriovoraceae bacterium]